MKNKYSFSFFGVCNELFIQNNPIIASLFAILDYIFRNESSPSANKLILTSLSILILDGYKSVRNLFIYSSTNLSNSSLNSYYYLFDYSVVNYELWWEQLLKSFTDKDFLKIKGYLFFSIDDTIFEKFGKKFEFIANLFDNSAHDERKYKNAHCWVAIVLSLPILFLGREFVISFPVGFKLWEKDGPTKLEIAANLIKWVSSIFDDSFQKIVLCDSWYPKGPVKNLIETIKNLTIVANVRSDTSLRDLPVEKKGRGRKPKYGKKLNIYKDFELKEYGDCQTRFKIGYRSVKTRLFGSDRIVTAFVTEPVSGGSKRLFICTNPSVFSDFNIDWLPSEEAKIYASNDKNLIPYCAYQFRWNIEVVFLEMKQHWNLGGYMLRSKVGMERLVNLQAIVYALVELLPLFDPSSFSRLVGVSHQERRFRLGRLLYGQQILSTLLKTLQDAGNSISLTQLPITDAWLKGADTNL